MNVVEKMKLDFKGLHDHGAINIVIFGDSVSHGCFGDGEIDYDAAYWNILRKKILAINNYVPVNVINSAIGGTTAHHSIPRMQAQVFDHHPDLVIICFGLNDVNDPLEKYLDSLRQIFQKCNDEGVQAIFMTPNMLNTYVAEDTPPKYLSYAHKTAEMQNSGRMDTFMSAAAELAVSMNISLCDCYSVWKKLSETQNTTLLLANRINHPTREMHGLFANELFKVIFKKDDASTGNGDSTMWRE